MDKPASFAIYMTLYYTGMREGELLALTPADVDLEKMTIRINKSFQRLGGEDVVSTPKTPKSNRVITIPAKLRDCLKDYMAQCYDLQPEDRLFPYTKHFLSHEMERGCKLSGVKKIRVHDIRHSHASLLVEMGFSPLLIAERLGHERVQTTMETYSHLYPNKQTEVASQLDDLM
jgi:integrase